MSGIEIRECLFRFSKRVLRFLVRTKCKFVVVKSSASTCRKNIADLVPKSIMAFMVNRAKEVMQRELVSKLYKEGKFKLINLNWMCRYCMRCMTRES